MSKDEQQKRGGFVPVGDLARDLPGVQVPDCRQALAHFTQLDQVTQLVRLLPVLSGVILRPLRHVSVLFVFF